MIKYLVTFNPKDCLLFYSRNLCLAEDLQDLYEKIEGCFNEPCIIIEDEDGDEHDFLLCFEEDYYKFKIDIIYGEIK